MNTEAVTRFISQLPWDGLPRGSAAQLAVTCNVTDASVSKWKQGAAAPSPNHWRALEELFKLKPHSIAEQASSGGTADVDVVRSVAVQLETIRQMMQALDEQLGRVARELSDMPLGR